MTRPGGSSTARRARAAALAAWAALLPVACASAGGHEPPPGLTRLWREYLELAPQRALAIAGDPARVWVAGLSGGHALRSEAEEAALERCRARRAARRMQAPCRLYASGDEIVWDR